MASSTKIYCLIVVGAWHSTAVYADFIRDLERAGYHAGVIMYPSINAADPLAADCASDIAYARQQLMPLLDEGRDVLLMPHSYGGIPIGAAAYQQSKTERAARGQPGGVIGMVYVAAFAVAGGLSHLEFMGQHAPWVKVDDSSPGDVAVMNPAHTFYHDLPTERAEALATQLQRQANRTFETKITTAAWEQKEFDGRRAYLMCTDDQALPLFVQQKILDDSNREWIIKKNSLWPLAVS